MIKQIINFIVLNVGIKKKIKKNRKSNVNTSYDNIQLNKQILNINSLSKLYDLTIKHSRSFNIVNTTTLLSRYAKLSFKMNHLLTKDEIKILLKTISSKINTIRSKYWQSRHISQLLWATAKLGLDISILKEYNIYPLILSHASSIKKFKEQEISNIIWSLGKLDFEIAENKNHHMLYQIISLAGNNYNTQGISNIIYGFSLIYKNVHDNSKELNSLFEKMIISKVNELSSSFNSQELSNMLYSLTKLKDVLTDKNIKMLYKKIIYLIDQYIDQNTLSSQHFSNILWSSTKINSTNIDFIKKMFKKLTDIHSFNIQELSMCLWVLATCELLTMKIEIEYICVKIYNKQQNLANMQTLSTILWSLAKLDYKAQEENFYSILIQSIDIVSCNIQHIATITWSLARLDLSSLTTNIQSLMFNVTSELLKQLTFHQTQSKDVIRHLSMIIWSYAKLKIKNDQVIQLFNQIADIFINSINNTISLNDIKCKYTIRDITDIIWSYSELNIQHVQLMSYILPILLYSLKHDLLKPEHMVKIFGRDGYKQAGGNMKELNNILDLIQHKTYNFDHEIQIELQTNLPKKER